MGGVLKQQEWRFLGAGHAIITGGLSACRLPISSQHAPFIMFWFFERSSLCLCVSVSLSLSLSLPCSLSPLSVLLGLLTNPEIWFSDLKSVLNLFQICSKAASAKTHHFSWQKNVSATLPSSKKKNLKKEKKKKKGNNSHWYFPDSLVLLIISGRFSEWGWRVRGDSTFLPEGTTVHCLTWHL